MSGGRPGGADDGGRAADRRVALAVRRADASKGRWMSWCGPGVSRSIASFLEACLAASANVLVVGSGPGVVCRVAALLPGRRRRAGGAGGGYDDVAVAQAHVMPLALGARARAAIPCAPPLASSPIDWSSSR